MNIYSISQTALRSMRANKVRTLLTVLGMVIGVTAIMIIFSAGEGIKNLLNAQVESFGTNIIHTEVKAPTNKAKGNMDHEGSMSIAMGTQITTLKLSDLEEIKRLPNISDGYGVVMGQDIASYNSYRKKVTLMGVSPSYINIDKSKIEEGRFFSDAEDRSLDKVAIIGQKIKKDFFGDQNPLGQEIRIGKNKFTVIGTLQKRGGGMGMDFDTYVYIPVRTAQKKVSGIDYLFYMEATVKDMSKQKETAAQMRDILRRNHNITPDIDSKTGEFLTNKDDFRTVTMEEMLSIMSTVTNAITILLLAIVAISLVVGGIGIMNIMYVIVSERTAEIGLRKAVGAHYHDIMGQFLAESALITLVGAIIGIFLGSSISFLISVVAQSQNLDWTFVVPIKAVVVSVAFSLFCGLVFGLMPARKAARLEPIEALRNE